MNENKEMEEATSIQDGTTAPQAKRSNVAAQWRKREEAMKAANVKAKEKARDIDFEEKKEVSQDFDQDAGKEGKAETPESKTAASPSTDMGSYRRSNIRDSWKKKAATSPYSPQESPSTPRNTDSPSNANSAAFDELKNKWKKFGVQNDGDTKPESDGKQISESDVTSDVKQTVENEAKGDAKQLAETEPKESNTEFSKSTLGEDTQRITKGSRAAVARRMGSSRFKSRFDRTPQTSTKSDEKSETAADQEKKGEILDPFAQTTESWTSFPPSAFPLDQDPPKSPVATSHSWQGEAAPTSPDSAISHSSLSSRASRRLRDIRARKQALRNGDEQGNMNVQDMDDKNDPEPLSMDKSTDYEQSQRSKITVESPLQGIIPSSMEDIVPSQFFSTKDSQIDSLTSVLNNTSFGQIANDIREEASTIFELSIVNEGVKGLQSTLSSWGFGDFFSSQSSEKSIRRPQSPTEEVAIEVEYVADPDE